MSPARKNDESAVEPQMERIAKAVSDGAPVDWDGATQENPDARPLIEGLRFVESVAEAHRRILKSDTGSSPPSTSGDPS